MHAVLLKGRGRIKLKVYLDNCCYNRPYDDQNQIRIELETKSKLFIQQLIVDQKIELVSSYIAQIENSDNPFIIRRGSIKRFLKLASLSIEESPELISIAENLKKIGLKTKDALHVACAIIADCDYFISTDDRILKHKDERIKIAGPVEFILIWEGIKNE
jgi:predicted nucleic acid-binding protein